MSTTDPSGLKKLQMHVVHLVNICNTGEQMFAHSNPTTTVHFFNYDFWRRRQLLAHKADYLGEAWIQRDEKMCAVSWRKGRIHGTIFLVREAGKQIWNIGDGAVPYFYHQTIRSSGHRYQKWRKKYYFMKEPWWQHLIPTVITSTTEKKKHYHSALLSDRFRGEQSIQLCFCISRFISLWEQKYTASG